MSKEDKKGSKPARLGSFPIRHPLDDLIPEVKVSEPVTPKIFERSNTRTTEQANKRTTKRYSFEIYKDQELQIAEALFLHKQSGKKGNISASSIIRKALDEYMPRLIEELTEEKKKTQSNI